jgi:hypothetical protein
MNHLEDLDAYVVRGEYLEEERRETNWQRRKAFAFFLASLKQDYTQPMAADCYPTPEEWSAFHVKDRAFGTALLHVLIGSYL